MAITDYASLQTTVADYLARSDLTSAIPGFIRFCEVHAQRELRVRYMETIATVSTVGGTALYAVPNDYLEARAFILETSIPAALDYMTPAAMVTKYASYSNGQPQSYSTIGQNFQLAPTPDGVYTAQLIYYAKIPSLDGVSVTSNWLLANYPDVYLYGSLLEAAPYLKDDERIQIWMGMFDRAIAEIKGEDARARWNGSPVAMKVDFTVG